MAHILVTSNGALISYLKRRDYFIMELYKSVVMNPRNMSELEELDKFILKHGISFDIISGNKPLPMNMRYEYSLNYKIPNSDIVSFKKNLKKFFSDTNKTIDKTFLILDHDIKIIDSMLVGIEMKLTSLVSVSSSKYYFDYSIMPKLSKFLKNLNINKKRKNVS